MLYDTMEVLWILHGTGNKLLSSLFYVIGLVGL